MSNKIFFALVFLGFANTSIASLDFSLSRDLSTNVFANSFNLGYSSDQLQYSSQEITNFTHDIGYTYSLVKSTVNLNSAVADLDADAATHSVNYSFSLYQKLMFDVGAAYTSFNSSEAIGQSYNYGISYKFGDFEASISLSNSDTQQKSDVIILNQNVADRVKFSMQATTYGLSYQLNDTFMTYASVKVYTTGDNLENLNTLLTTPLFLNRAGPSVANEIQNQLSGSTDLSLIYLIDDNWTLNGSLSTARTYLEPKDRSDSFTIGFIYEDYLNQEFLWRVEAYVTASRFEGDSETSNSGGISGGLTF